MNLHVSENSESVTREYIDFLWLRRYNIFIYVMEWEEITKNILQRWKACREVLKLKVIILPLEK